MGISLAATQPAPRYGVRIAFAIAVVSALVVGLGVYYGVFRKKDAPVTNDASGVARSKDPDGHREPWSASRVARANDPDVAQGCALEKSQWADVGAPASVKGRKVALVGKSASGACTDASVGRVRDENPSALFQSAYKMTSGDSSVYYLSQFVDHEIPAALLDEDRNSYTTYVAKSANTFASPVTANGLECELIVRPAPANESEARRMCLADERCSGYYKSGTLEPVLAMAGPGKCALSWARLPASEQPAEADWCAKFMGDRLWFTHNGSCEPICKQNHSRSPTGFCKGNCDPGFGKCASCSSDTCHPVTEDACPVGWFVDRREPQWPKGVCRPFCQSETTGRETDGYCREKDGDCASGFGTASYGLWPMKTYYCKHGSGHIEADFYTPKQP
jgi:hypothetical protein